ncbi:hypothetical protein BJ875DRAFT_57833 [Amylocarpus encephaloides]|uniref:Secreted protein n=1 Tax=Amylocarpus encephaloides TaxID=45428 RepID=A0A9P7YR99_9HELO|nr:hypothetical protein BJ875DRAFT_57833 [Amylocarpus encephaloides]
MPVLAGCLLTCGLHPIGLLRLAVPTASRRQFVLDGRTRDEFSRSENGLIVVLTQFPAVCDSAVGRLHATRQAFSCTIIAGSSEENINTTGKCYVRSTVRPYSTIPTVVLVLHWSPPSCFETPIGLLKARGTASHIRAHGSTKYSKSARIPSNGIEKGGMMIVVYLFWTS